MCCRGALMLIRVGDVVDATFRAIGLGFPGISRRCLRLCEQDGFRAIRAESPRDSGVSAAKLLGCSPAVSAEPAEGDEAACAEAATARRRHGKAAAVRGGGASSGGKSGFAIAAEDGGVRLAAVRSGPRRRRRGSGLHHHPLKPDHRARLARQGGRAPAPTPCVEAAACDVVGVACGVLRNPEPSRIGGLPTHRHYFGAAMLLTTFAQEGALTAPQRVEAQRAVSGARRAAGLAAHARGAAAGILSQRSASRAA